MAVAIELAYIEGLKDAQALVVFREKDGQRFGAINMAAEDAISVRYGTQRRRGPRPGSHDVIHDILLTAGIVVERFIIHGTSGNMVLALLDLNQGGHRFSVDCRPSDGLAIAVRMDAPLFCEEQILELMNTDFQKAQAAVVVGNNEHWQRYFADKGDDIPKS